MKTKNFLIMLLLALMMPALAIAQNCTITVSQDGGYTAPQSTVSYNRGGSNSGFIRTNPQTIICNQGESFSLFIPCSGDYAPTQVTISYGNETQVVTLTPRLDQSTGTAFTVPSTSTASVTIHWTPIVAKNVNVGDFTYSLLYYDSSITPSRQAIVKTYNGTLNSFRTSESIIYSGNTYTVVSVEQNAFKNNTSISLLRLPSSIREIPSTMMQGCTSLKSCVIDGPITEIPFKAFDGCTSLNSSTTTLSSNLFTVPATVTTIGGEAFMNCTSLKTVAIYTPVRAIAGSAFNGCSDDLLIRFQPSGSNTTLGTGSKLFSDYCGVHKMEVMSGITAIGDQTFAGCNALTNFTLTSDVQTLGNNVFNGSVQDLSVTINKGTSAGLINSYLFQNVSNVKSLNIGSGITQILAYAFKNCTNLTTVSLPSTLTTIAYQAFYGCPNLTNIVIPSSVTSILNQAFYNATNVTVNWTTPLTLSSNPFSSDLQANATLHVPTGTVDAYRAANYWKNFGTITDGTTTSKLDYAVLSTDGKTLTFYHDSNQANREGNVYSLNTGSVNPGWYGQCASVESVVFNSSFASARPTSTFRWFSGMSNLTSIAGLSYLNTSEVTNMGSMFYGCSKLTSLNLNLSGFNTSKVTKMASMFQNCSGLTSLNVAGFNTANVTDMTAMFYGCSKLTSLDLSSFNTSKVTSMSMMFYTCYALTSLDISSFRTPEVTSMSYMFSNCRALTSLDVSKFSTVNVTNMSQMFTSCWNLTELDVSSFTTVKVTNMSAMFSSCRKLTTIDVSGFITENVTNMKEMFSNCISMKRLDLQKWDTSSVTDMTSMFSNASELTTIYVGDSWKTAKVTASNNMFSDCTKLVGGAGTTYNELNPKDATYAHIDGGTANPGYFTVPRNITFADATVKTLLTTSYIGIDANGDGEVSEAEAASATANQIQDAFRQDPTRAATITSFDEFQYFTGLTEISNSTFSFCTALKSITLPSTITSIDNFAFDGCAALENIVLNEGLTTIGRNAFEDYTGIVTLPSTVTSIDSWAFTNCAGLKVSWTTPPDYNNFLENQQFGPNNADPKKPLYVPIGSYDAYHVPGWWRFDVREYGIIHFADANVKATCVDRWDTNGDGELSAEEAEVVDNATFSGFKNNNNITSFDELKYFIGLTQIPSQAFQGCSNLTNITLPRNITSIGDYAFQGCTALTSIDVPEGVTTIGAQAFMSCSNLTELNLASYGLETIGALAFTGTQLQRFTIPGSVTSMDDAFQAQTTVIPKYVTAPWWEPIAITENTFPMRVQATLFVPEGKEDVYRAAPYWQDFGTIVSKIDFNDPAVKAICIANFDSNGDGELTLDEAAAVTTLGTAFKGNTEIRSFEELKYFTGLDDGTEYHNHVLTGEAFMGCSNLVTVTLPANITQIYNGAFQNCTSLQYVNGMPDAVRNLGDATFEGCTSLQSLNLPTSIGMINLRLFYGCSSLRWITIPERVTYYGNEAFAGCTALTQVTVKNPTPATGSNIYGDPFPTRANINLIVPPHCSDAYSTADYWKDFFSLQESEPDWLQYTDENGDIYQYEPGYSAQLYRFADNSSRTTFVMPATISVDGATYDVTAIAGLTTAYLQTLTIPASVTALKDDAFSCTPVPGSGFSLKDIYMRSSQPPTAGSQASWMTSIVSFNHLMQAQYPDDPSKQVSLKDITLHVPTGSLAAYQAATFWKEFTFVEYSVPATEAYALLSTDGKTLTFYYDCEKANREGTPYALNTGSGIPAWSTPSQGATKVVFDPSFADARPTTTANWFYNMSYVTTITGIENLNTSEVTNMEGMFEFCNSLESIDLSHFVTDKVTDMNNMFKYCEALTSIDLSGFNTEKVTDMRSMFESCAKLTIIDISSFNTPVLTATQKMFMDCKALRTIYVGDGWNTTHVTTQAYRTNMFKGDLLLTGMKGTAYADVYGSGNYEDIIYARVDGGTSAPGYFSWKPYAHLSADGKTLTFYNDGKSKEKIGGHIYDVLKYGYSGWYADGSAANITDVVFDPSFADARPTTTAFWFYNMPYLTRITGLDKLNTSEVTTMRAMFYNCQNLTSLNLSSFNTDNVTNMSYMFASCYNLRSLDLSSFNTDNVTNMQSMFGSCADLRSLDLSRFNTAKVTNMSNMFLFCESLTTLDLSSFNTAAVKSMLQMFGACGELTTIYAGDGWTTAALESDGKQRLFLNDTKLVGGAGTTYDESAYIVTSEDNGGIDAQYARIDAPGAPGYFTREGAPMHGDVNGDGSVTIADVTSLVNIILGKSPAPATGVADVNTDGSVTIADVTALVNKILGKN